MKNLFLSFTFVIIAILNGAGQDIITMKSGDDLNGKILKLNPNDVVFIPKGIKDTITLSRDDIVKLRYQNGTLVQLVDKNAVKNENSTETPSGYDSLYYIGVSDANRYYDGYHGASIGTLVSALVFPFNIIPAIACSSTPPNDYNLTIPNPKLRQNPAYYNGYRNQAHIIKRHKVWMSYGIGSGAMIAFYILMNAF